MTTGTIIMPGNTPLKTRELQVEYVNIDVERSNRTIRGWAVMEDGSFTGEVMRKNGSSKWESIVADPRVEVDEYGTREIVGWDFMDKAWLIMPDKMQGCKLIPNQR